MSTSTRSSVAAWVAGVGRALDLMLTPIAFVIAAIVARRRRRSD
jgi:hypothetical protein